MFWPVLTAFAFAVLLLGANYTRFTWWGWTAFFAYVLLNSLYGSAALANRDLFFATIAGIIVLGVITMAAFDDPESMLAQVVDDYGALVYFLGTFTVHYLPAAVVFTNCAPLRHLDAWEAKQIALAVSVFCLYLLHEDPRTIYGVDVGQTLAAGGALAASALLLLGLWRLQSE
tara:strand:+ start:1686 stop:2204 length:519 start_codon:yes stop_codon:yes gene_type:complete